MRCRETGGRLVTTCLVMERQPIQIQISPFIYMSDFRMSESPYKADIAFICAILPRPKTIVFGQANCPCKIPENLLSFAADFREVFGHPYEAIKSGALR